MAAPRYRAPTADMLRIVALDALVAVLDRRSGMTHLIASPAPEILALLAGDGLTLDDLAARIAAEYEGEPDRVALADRVAELVEAGLVAAA